MEFKHSSINKCSKHKCYLALYETRDNKTVEQCPICLKEELDKLEKDFNTASHFANQFGA